MDVYLNGVLLDPASDYTATSGTSVVLGSGATAGDTLECVVYDVFSVFSGNFNTNVSVNGNLDVTNNMTVDGNVGIGTNNPSPSSKVEVVGGIRITNTATSANFSTLSDGGGLVVTSGNSNPMYFYTGGSERMRINSSGNLGIGTTSPTFTFGSGLEVQRAGISTVRVENSSAAVSGELSAYDASFGTLLYTLSAHPLTFGTSGGERMKIDASGRITSITQPSFVATKSNGNYTGGGSITSWNNVSTNVGSHFNGTTGIFTAPVAGKIFIYRSCIISFW